MMASQEQIRRQTGGYLNASPLQSVAGVLPVFGELLARVQALPFVPASWTEDVKKAMAQAGDNRLWVPAYAIRVDAWREGKTDPVYPDAPAWLNDPASRTAWNTLVDWWTERLQPILAGWARDEAATLSAANADLRFWSALHAIVKPIAVVGDGIIAAPGVLADGASKAATGALRGLLPVLAIVAALGVAVLVFKSKLTGK